MLSSKSKIRRLIWLIIILVCVAISLYLVHNTFSNPSTSTTITNEPNLSLEFPAVTICNVNAFSAEIVESYGLDPATIYNSTCYNPDPFCQPPDELENDPILQQLANNSIERFIHTCKFGDRSCDNIDKDFEFSLNDFCTTL